ncbi:MAG: purine-nucleoside phosphorylase [Elusimicrobia bacterium]|nr:purine-nucleoside phosphorylase [Elusimicrobiota bacterium]
MNVRAYVNAIRASAKYLKSKAPGVNPKVAIILGSGLSGAVPRLRDPKIIPYASVPGFPRATVSGHAGKMILGRLGGVGVAVMQGRFHYYEGHAMEAITLPVRALEHLGLKTLVATAAVGSMRSRIKPGDIVVVKDHINMMGANPLRAFHEQEFGDMFPDMVDTYDPALRRLALSICRSHKVPAHEGVYTAVCGPSYETPAEIRAFRTLGGDVTGMSVVPEATVARQMGVRVCALAWISNMAAGMSKEALSHPDVLAMGEKVAARLRLVLESLLRKI